MKVNKYIVIIIVALVAINIYQWMNSDKIVLDGSNEILIEHINKNQQRLDSLESVRLKYESDRDAKLDSITLILDHLNKNIVRTKDLEKYEKQVLFNASDADNLQYFHDYINHYRTKQRTGKDTIH